MRREEEADEKCPSGGVWEGTALCVCIAERWLLCGKPLAKQAIEPQPTSAQLAEVGGGLKEQDQGSLGWETTVSRNKQSIFLLSLLVHRSGIAGYTSKRRAPWAP